MKALTASEHIRICRTVGLREQRGKTAVTQSWQSWSPGDIIPTQHSYTGRHCWDQRHWRKGLYSPKGLQRLRSPDWKADHRTMAIFLRRGRNVPGHVECQECLFRVFSLVPVSLMLATILYPEFQMLFFSLFIFSLDFSSLAAAVIVHCVWGWTRANPWSWNGRKHLSGINHFLSLP